MAHVLHDPRKPRDSQASSYAVLVVLAILFCSWLGVIFLSGPHERARLAQAAFCQPFIGSALNC